MSTFEASWVRACGARGAWQFDEVDVARIRLIYTLRTEMEIGRRRPRAETRPS